MTPIGIGLLFAAAVATGTALLYNALISLRNRAASAWSDIEVQLERRHDLVGNLVETVKGYAAHERQTLQHVVEARDRASAAEHAGPGEAGPAESVLSARLRPVFALAEAYPDLKASQGYQDLHDALVALEDDLQNARRYYNAVVRDFNTKIQTLPGMLVARPFGFQEREYFQLADPGDARVPEIRL